MHSLKKLSFLFSRILRNNIRRTLTSQSTANADVDKAKGMYILNFMNDVASIGLVTRVLFQRKRY